MIITKTSSLTGKSHSMDLDVTWDQLHRFNAGKEYIQDIFPALSSDEREFILTGITPKEWNETFKNGE